MTKIIYFTLAQDLKSYQDYLSNWKVSPNTSNQNFHNKLIRALALKHKVDVISVRPINFNYSFNKLASHVVHEDNINWNYIKVTRSKVDKLLFNDSRINRVAKNIVLSDSVIVVDTLNLSLLRYAYLLGKKHNIKVYGVCTDNPNNISFISPSYKAKLLKYGRKLDGYIALTKDIEALYNVNHKKSVLIDGISEELSFDKPIINDNYIFFGGSLMKEYGVYNLIDAFNQLETKNLKLVICGHHEPNDFKKYIENNRDIIYLGSKSYAEVANLEHYSILCVNPRPINEQIDKYSIPSKVIEYMANGALVVSVKNSILEENYSQYIVWAVDNSPESLKASIENAINLNKNEIINEARKKVLERTSKESVSKIISEQLF